MASRNDRDGSYRRYDDEGYGGDRENFGYDGNGFEEDSISKYRRDNYQGRARREYQSDDYGYEDSSRYDDDLRGADSPARSASDRGSYRSSEHRSSHRSAYSGGSSSRRSGSSSRGSSRSKYDSRSSSRDSSRQSESRRDASRTAIQRSDSREVENKRSGGYSRGAAASRYQDSRRKGSRRRKILIGILIAVVVIFGGAAAAVAGYVHHLNSQIQIDEDLPSLTPTDNVAASEPFYALLMGVDSSEWRETEDIYGGAYRSDTIILARVAPAEKLITLVSIHRDTVVDLSAYGGTGKDKINSAFTWGGRDLMIQTISEFAGVPITHYAEVNFDGFAAIVDALGGVEVDVEMSFYDPYLYEGLEAGYQTLNGDQALVYARARHAFDDLGDGDRYRAKHQRQVIMAIAEKIINSDVATLTNTLNTIVQYVSTDMSVGDIISIAKSFVGCDFSQCFYSGMEPTWAAYEDGVWYEYVDQEGWDAMMARVDAGLDPGVDTAADEEEVHDATSDTSVTSVTVLNGSMHVGAAGSAGDTLTANGFVVETVGDADYDDFVETLVVYKDEAYAGQAQAISDALGIGLVQANDNRYAFDTNVLVVIGADWA